MMWEVDDIEATVRELRSRGVVFEEYDLPGLKTVDGIAEIEGQYPSKGSGERGAWFRDSEGNMLGIGELVAVLRGAIRDGEIADRDEVDCSPNAETRHAVAVEMGQSWCRMGRLHHRAAADGSAGM